MDAYSKLCATLDKLSNDEIVSTWNALLWNSHEHSPDDSFYEDVTWEEWQELVYSEKSARNL